MSIIHRSLLALFTLLAACQTPEEHFDAVVDEARVCSAGDTCVVAGFTPCSCGVPVNEASLAEVEAAAEPITCCDVFGRCIAVDCIAQTNPRCEGGLCTADTDG